MYLFIKLIVGKQGRKQTEKIKQGVAAVELKIGIMVAVRPDMGQAAAENSSEAWIGEVVAKPEDNFVQVGWYSGSIQGAWRKLSRANSTKNVDSIPLSSIYLWGFKLLKNGHLEKSAKNEIISEMQQIYESIPKTRADPLIDSSDNDD